MIDLITVVFEKEIPLIEIQARSIEFYIDTDIIKNIYVVVNDDNSIVSLIDPTWWGIHANKVQIIPRSSFGVNSMLTGWSSQQMYKLLAANSSESEWSMCLDAKTWFVQKLEWDKLFDTHGKVRFGWFPTISVFKPAEESLNKFYDINMSAVIGPGGVPFMFHTNTVKEMISDIEHKTSTKFLDFFSEKVNPPYLITEFMLYSAFVIYKYGNYSSLYSTQYYSPCNISEWEIQKFDKLLSRMHTSGVLTASIHSKVYANLSAQQLDNWFNFLVEKTLTTNIENTKNRLNILIK
jgi:hypothetical protein